MQLAGNLIGDYAAEAQAEQVVGSLGLVAPNQLDVAFANLVKGGSGPASGHAAEGDMDSEDRPILGELKCEVLVNRHAE